MARTVLLDLDGTLTDPREGVLASFRCALEGVGVVSPGDAVLERGIGPPLHEALGELLGPTRGADVRAAVALFRERYGATGLFQNRVYPGIPAVLEELRQRGHRLLVCTSKPTPFAERILAHFGLDRFFDHVHGSGLGPTGGDKSGVMADALAAAGLAPRDAVMVGDRWHDAFAARAHGVPMVGVLWGYGSREELLEAGAACVVHAPGELPAALASLGGRSPP
jgi:phosphoglycolate phosphatase